MNKNFFYTPYKWIALAGFMGTGKTRIALELSRYLALHTVDTDKIITKITGCSIEKIFEAKGEKYFRYCEQEVVQRSINLDNVIISLGGGAFVNDQNRELLLSRGPVIVLWASPETVFKRIKNSQRPLINTKNPLETIKYLQEKRKNAYLQGTIHINSDNKDVGEVTEEIINQLWKLKNGK